MKSPIDIEQVLDRSWSWRTRQNKDHAGKGNRPSSIVVHGVRLFDDDGHVLEREKTMAVCDKTFQLYKREPYTEDIIAIEPLEPISLEEATSFDCKRTAFRHPRETKGKAYQVTDLAGLACCEPGNDCC